MSRQGEANDSGEAQMPTEAKRETVAELTEEARSSSAMIVSEYRGLKVSEIGEIRQEPAQAERHVPRRQEPTDEDRGEGRRVGGPGHPARRSHRGRVRQGRRGRCRQGSPGRLPAVPPHQGHRSGHRRSGGGCRRRRLGSRSYPRATFFWLRSRAPSPRPWPTWPVCSMPRCGTSPGWSGPGRQGVSRLTAADFGSCPWQLRRGLTVAVASGDCGAAAELSA